MSRGDAAQQRGRQGEKEERQDRHKVLLARMAQLHLDGLVDMTHEHAK